MSIPQHLTNTSNHQPVDDATADGLVINNDSMSGLPGMRLTNPLPPAAVSDGMGTAMDVIMTPVAAQPDLPQPARISNAIWLSSTPEADEAVRKFIKDELYEGHGECFLELGQDFGPSFDSPANTTDNAVGFTAEQMSAALARLHALAQREGFIVIDIPGLDDDSRDMDPPTSDPVSADNNNNVLHAVQGRSVKKTVFLRRSVDESDFHETRIAVVGNVDAGKSTLLGVLTHGELDNGRGLARQKLFRHKHEIESGRTSSVGNDILGFDAEGNIVNSRFAHGGTSSTHHLDWSRICENSQKVITFIDLAGHEKYLKTTVFGMTGHAPDYCMLVVGANAGASGMMKEHLSLALALKVPVYIIVTKADMAPKQVLDDTLSSLHRILKSPGCAKIPLEIKNWNAVVKAVSGIGAVRGAIAPIFLVSSVTGDGLHRLQKFLNFLPCRIRADRDAPALFQIDETYSVPGVGTVISGTCLQGRIAVGDVLQLGPDRLGVFVPMPIKSIHRKRMNVMQVCGGQSASFALKKKIKRTSVRKGMVLAAAALPPRAVWQFIGRIIVLHHPTTMHKGYQAMVHVGATRQTATLTNIESKEYLRTGDKAICRFRFMRQPEFLITGERLVFREGRTKAVGQVMELCDEEIDEAANSSSSSSASKPLKSQQQPTSAAAAVGTGSNRRRGRGGGYKTVGGEKRPSAT